LRYLHNEMYALFVIICNNVNKIMDQIMIHFMNGRNTIIILSGIKIRSMMS
jgi:hypothetical protein